MRILYLISGFLALGFAILGIVLPLLPTTPLVLLSAFCFARSSQRFHSWLINHPRFGTMISDWQERGCINKKAKICAVSMIIISFAISVALQLSFVILAIQFVVLSCVSVFILTRPSV